MKLVMIIPYIISHEGKHKNLYVIDENTILYNEYTVNMI